MEDRIPYELGRDLAAVDLKRPMMGIGNLGAVNYYNTAASGGTPGAASGFFVAYLCRIITVANAQFWAHCSNAAAGWQMRQLAATTLQFRAWDGGAVSRVSPALTLTGLVGKVVAVMGVHTGTALRLYANRVQVSTETALTGYTAPTAGMGVTLANQGNSGCEFYGMTSGLGVPTLADFQRWCDAVRRARAIVRMPLSQHLWGPVRSTAPIPNRLGGAPLLKQGAAHTLVANRSPEWAW